ncbi:hypothetical protein B0A48_01043 [Cryoendolithus antarcticus]|uniref:tRNA/rRNA methyltransferase SpoU type domain-containing protein n=1 Tax=Cryoendolithus antarcticus TaxID=1507870 RepID=A0A1V8TS44_9PEZI|nr:hypothetical protein B0A48_01043 [Cryoendolithus antarcticus]
MKGLSLLFVSFIVAATQAYTPPRDLQDGLYTVNVDSTGKHVTKRHDISGPSRLERFKTTEKNETLLQKRDFPASMEVVCTNRAISNHHDYAVVQQCIDNFLNGNVGKPYHSVVAFCRSGNTLLAVCDWPADHNVHGNSGEIDTFNYYMDEYCGSWQSGYIWIQFWNKAVSTLSYLIDDYIMIKTGAAALVLRQALDHEQRSTLSTSLLAQLHSQYDEVVAGILLDLATDLRSSTANDSLIETFVSQIEQGSGDSVAALVVDSAVFLERLLLLASERLALASDYATSTPDVLLPGYAEAIALSFRHVSTQENATSSLVSAGHWMGFLTRASGISLDVEADSYWQLMESGLRHGDAERRKLSLDIMKSSVAYAVWHKKLLLVTQDTQVPSAMIIAQYNRFLTIFETLVLARYANLVAECENDLALLASPRSILPSRWLFVLLASGLDRNMQDQNRKYIGGWMLRTDLKYVDNAPGFIDLLRDPFMPWAVEGTLYVSSTKRHGKRFCCQHGERVAKLISSVLRRRPDKEAVQSVLNMLLDFLVARQASLFTSAAIHILIGVADGVAQLQDLASAAETMDKVLAISSWNTLSDIASDILVIQCHRIYQSLSISTRTTQQNLSDLSRHRLAALSAKVERSERWGRSDSYSQDAGLLQLSNRDLAIDQALTKCQKLLTTLDEGIEWDSTELLSRLQDLYTDVDFLEYPRQLLLTSPRVCFHPGILRRAVDSSRSGDRQIAEFLQSALTQLAQVANRRSFAFAPLMVSLREGLLTVPEAAGLLNVQDFLVTIAQCPPQPNVDLIMEYAMLTLLDSIAPGRDNTAIYYGFSEGHGFAAYIDLIGRLGAQYHGLALGIADAILSRWKQQKDPPPSVSPWKTTLQLQVLLVCLEHAHTSESLERLGHFLDDLLHILALEPLPRYRHIIEWMIARMQLAHPSLQSHTRKLLTTKDHHSNPKFLASLMKIGVILAGTPDSTEDLASTLAMTFVSHSASSKIVVRHEAQWSFPQLMDICRRRSWKNITQNPAYTTLEDYIRALPRFGDPPPERILSALDPIKDHTLTNLTEGLWTQLDDTRPPLTSRDDFLRVYEADTRLPTEAWPSCIMSLGPPIIRPPGPEPFAKAGPEPIQASTTPLTSLGSKALQTKGTAYFAHPSSSSPSTPLHRTILISSLVDNALNLGGLSRCAEIFGAEAMYVRDPRVVADKAFISVSVSSHNHLAILPCGVEALPALLEAKKREEGWRIVGIEQTDRSLVVGSKELGEALLGGENGGAGREGSKIVLVVGSEREGIPAAVLAVCDVLVEIPQVGVTRSLNVQTAAAVVLFELGRLRRGKAGVGEKGVTAVERLRGGEALEMELQS